MVRVKICGLTNPADVEMALTLGADAVGFVRYPKSARFVDEATLQTLVRLSGPYVPTVAVYGGYDESDTRLTTLIQASEFPSGFRFDQSVVLTIHQGSSPILSQDQMLSVSSILIDAMVPGEYGGTGVTVDWHLAAEFVRQSPSPVTLAGGLTPENVAEAIRIVQPYAVDVCSGVEMTTGKKDPIKMRDFIHAVTRG